MIGYAMLGTNNLDKAKAFYDAVLAKVGAARTMDFGNSQAYGTAPDKPMLAIGTPENGAPATFGNGTMMGLAAPSRAAVDATHAEALAQGGTCGGPPGLRGDTFYAAYFRDLDGNKLCAYHIG